MLSRDWEINLALAALLLGFLLVGPRREAHSTVRQKKRHLYCQGAEAYRRSNATKGF